MQQQADVGGVKAWFAAMRGGLQRIGINKKAV
jgi:hypothetical protein